MSGTASQEGIWFEPELLAEKYRAKGAAGTVRHLFKGLREDL
jgi:hypothetical protein